MDALSIDDHALGHLPLLDREHGLEGIDARLDRCPGLLCSDLIFPRKSGHGALQGAVAAQLPKTTIFPTFGELTDIRPPNRSPVPQPAENDPAQGVTPALRKPSYTQKCPGAASGNETLPWQVGLVAPMVR